MFAKGWGEKGNGWENMCICVVKLVTDEQFIKKLIRFLWMSLYKIYLKGDVGWVFLLQFIHFLIKTCMSQIKRSTFKFYKGRH